MPLHLMEHPEDVSVVRLPRDEDPTFEWRSGPLASLTRTAEETSVVCASAAVPPDARSEGPFRAVEVAGPLDFSAVGVFAEILAPLVEARISVLGLSTFDTDWVLVPAERTGEASAAWRRAGFVITPTTLGGGAS
ncbi:ACT domain-containing protein [Phycicoccus endophyticus]|uniref:ACT domain-containing protein n=1 Tax=Phycicoccus endophyticus TaxID=1690220 RepID=A0A7G9R444_9MICO|nr:ACT domain-containing protein [Phycicoccus endophyticus]NHI18212.1 ACT domain-containing protein [Phycicoccus endophyticus]QNN50369.1 ACT domain-containing protein [Phycicoccus endophyticus]